jgi:hypothetical protein
MIYDIHVGLRHADMMYSTEIPGQINEYRAMRLRKCGDERGKGVAEI